MLIGSLALTLHKAEGQPAAGLFAGDTYVGLVIYIVKKDLEYAQTLWDISIIQFAVTTRCYSALSIRDGDALKTEKGSNLYQFWGNQVPMTSPTKCLVRNILLIVPVMSTFQY